MLPGVPLPAIAAPSVPAGCLRCRHSERRTGGDVSVAGHQDRPLAFKKANDDLTQRLERLPPGHPSSPYNDDGTRKPPVPRLADRELPLPDEQAADADLDSPDAEEPSQRSLDTNDLTEEPSASLEPPGRDTAGQELRDGEPSADEVPGRDSQEREARASEPPSPEAATPDSRSWLESLPHLREQWERHKERWPQEQRPPVDRSTEEPGSWRGDSGRSLNPRDNAHVDAACGRIAKAETGITERVEDTERASVGSPGLRRVPDLAWFVRYTADEAASHGCDAEGRRLFTSAQQAITNVYRNARGQLPPPIDDIDTFWSPEERAWTSNRLAR